VEIRLEKKQKQEPTLAPSMNMHDPIEKKATDEEMAEGDSTDVTRLFLDRTPDK
jgi:hypothetical protein